MLSQQRIQRGGRIAMLVAAAAILLLGFTTTASDAKK
jgi:hypothetical protein